MIYGTSNNAALEKVLACKLGVSPTDLCALDAGLMTPSKKLIGREISIESLSA